VITVTCVDTPSAGAASAEVRWLPARVAELKAQNEVMAAQLAARGAQLEAAQAKLAVLAEQIQDLRRRLGKDSSTSSKPPSSDNPYKKKPALARIP
jgi:transposase